MKCVSFHRIRFEESGGSIWEGFRGKGVLFC